MSNDYKKDYINKSNNDFGSFAPQNKEGASSDVTGAKSNSAPKAETKPQTGSEGMGQAKVDDASIQNELNSVKNAASEVKSDIINSVTGDDPGSIKDKYQQEGAKIANSVKNSDIGNVVKETVSDGMKEAGMKIPVTGLFGKAKAGLAAGVNGLKALGSGLISSLKGAGAAMTAGTLKAGAAVGAALHVSATAGTALVLAGVIGVTSIPVVGGASYLTNRFTQKTDGCSPEEYDEPQFSAGAKGAVEWARMIANDDSFAYGEGDTAHHGGCYFCNTNVRKKARGYEKTYCCNPFTISAYAHGSGDEDILELCESGGNAQLCWEDSEEKWNAYHFELIGKPPMSQLRDGDIGFWNGHQWLVGDAAKGTIIDAGSEGWGPETIAERDDLAGYYADATGFARYVGDGKGAKPDAQPSNNSGVNANSSHDAFINRIGAAAKELWNPYHIYPSVMVAAACLESAYGTSDFARNRKNYFGIGAFDSNPNNAHSFATEKEAMEAYPKVFWSGADPNGYLKVITATSADDQAMKVHLSKYATDPDYYKKLRNIMDAYNLEERFDKGLRQFSPDLSKYGADVNGISPLDDASANYNEEVAEMTADDGCGGEMTGSKDKAYRGKGLVDVTATNGEKYIVLDTNWAEIMKVGRQGSQQCYQFSIAYCDLIMGGKFRCASDGNAFRSTYGDGGVNGDASKIGGEVQSVSSTDEAIKIAFEEIKQGRPVIVFVTGSSYTVTTNEHWVCIAGWTANAGSPPKWDDMVCIDPAYASHTSDGLHAVKGFNYGGTIVTFKNWQKAE